jgi:hypothetical protein
MSARAFQPLGGERVYAGKLVDVFRERFRHGDGEEVTREIVRHRGAKTLIGLLWLARRLNL